LQAAAFLIRQFYAQQRRWSGSKNHHLVQTHTGVRSDAARSGDGMIHRAELASGLDRICPVFRSFRSQLTGMTNVGTEVVEKKGVSEVVGQITAPVSSLSCCVTGGG